MENYIIEKFGSTLSYDNAAQLCIRLFCTLSSVPEIFHVECTKEGLATLFKILSKKGVILPPEAHESDFYCKNGYAFTEEQHWLMVIGSVFTDRNVVNESFRIYIDSTLER